MIIQKRRNKIDFFLYYILVPAISISCILGIPLSVYLMAVKTMKSKPSSKKYNKPVATITTEFEEDKQKHLQ